MKAKYLWRDSDHTKFLDKTNIYTVVWKIVLLKIFCTKFTYKIYSIYVCKDTYLCSPWKKIWATVPTERLPCLLTSTPDQWPDVEEEVVVLDSVGKRCLFQYLRQLWENNYALPLPLPLATGGVLGLDEHQIEMLEHVEEEGMGI